MAQHIGCQLQDGSGHLIKNSKLNFAPINLILWDFDKNKKKYQWLHTIDEYGDTTFNPLQTPYVIMELENLKKEKIDGDIQKLIDDFVVFIKKIDLHLYIKFIGD